MNKLGRWIRNGVAGIFAAAGTIIPLHGQDYSLSGRVLSLERTTGAPISQVIVDVDSSSHIAKTDANGYFTLNNIPAGVHNIRMSAPGRIGMFKQNYVLDGNKTLNVCLADTMQESPGGELVLKLEQYREMPPFNAYKGLSKVSNVNNEYIYTNSFTWKNITEGNLIPIRIVNATSLDSLHFFNALGACDGDGNWSDSPTNSVEYKQKREIYKITNDVAIDGWNKRGILVKFHSDGNYTLRTPDPYDNNYIFASEVNLRVNTERAIQKECKGRAWSRGDIFDRPSYMNSDNPLMTDLDHMLNIVFFNQWAAMARGEQQSNILDMENSPVIGLPISTEFTQPINNSTGLENAVQFIWKNKFGTESYKLEIATDAGYNNKVLSKDVMRIDTTVILNNNTEYFARVQTKNQNGASSWYNITFKTKDNINHPPSNFTTISPTGEIENQTDKQFNWHKSTDPDGNNITYTLTINGTNYNKTINNITDTLYNITANTLPGNKTLNWKVTANDGTLNTESNTTNINTKNHNPSPFTTIAPTGEIENQTDKQFNWHKSTDPDGNNITYTLTINGTNYNKTINNITDTLYNITANTLPGNKTLNWKVTANDGTLNTESNTTNINTKNHNPSPFTTIAPTGEIENQTDKQFNWHKSTDPDGNNITYTLTINGTNYNKTINNITDTLYNITANTLPGNKTLNWKVTANDGTLNTESNTTNINTKNHNPSPFTTIAPTGEIENQTDKQFNWHKSTDPDGNNITYTLTINGTNYNKTINNITDTLYNITANTLPGNKTLNWKVTANDGTLNTESNTTNINTKNHNPSKSIINLPNGMDVIDHTKPLSIEYTISTDPDNDPVTYNIRIWNASKDTTIFGINNTAYILPVGFLKAGLSNSIKVTSTDGNLFTDSDIKTFNTITGIEDVIVGAEYKIYPNPTTERVNLEYTLKQKAFIKTRIYDITGKLEKEIQEQEQYPGTYTENISMREYKSGIHIIQTEIKTSDNQIYKKTGKIIKK